MTLADDNLRIAALTTLRDAIDGLLAEQRTDHRDRLLGLYDDTGTKSFDVRLPGGAKVASISLTIPKPKAEVTDEAALCDWLVAHGHRGMVEVVEVPATTKRRVVPKALTALIAGLEPVDHNGGPMCDESGELVDGVAYVPAGRPSSFSLRFDTDGRVAVAHAYRAGELADVLTGTVLAPGVRVIER